MIPLVPIRNYKKIIAITFAITVLALIGGDAICSMNCARFPDKQNTALASAKKENNKKNHHGYVCHHHSGSRTTSDYFCNSSLEDQHNCCCKVANQFYQSLFKTNDSTILRTITPSLIFTIELSDYKHLLIAVGYLNPERIPPKILLLTKGNNLRIMMSSFLI